MDFDLAHAIPILTRTPDVLSALLSGLSNEWLLARENAGTWSPFDIIGHLIHGEKTDWIPRARMILEHGTGMTFEPFDRFAQFQESQGKSVPELLAEFAELRKANLGSLQAMRLTAAQLDSKGIHPEFGEVTLAQLLATWVVHDLSHIAQVAEAMARQYRDAVGPWRAYLPILGG